MALIQDKPQEGAEAQAIKAGMSRVLTRFSAFLGVCSGPSPVCS